MWMDRLPVKLGATEEVFPLEDSHSESVHVYCAMAQAVLRPGSETGLRLVLLAEAPVPTRKGVQIGLFEHRTHCSEVVHDVESRVCILVVKDAVALGPERAVMSAQQRLSLLIPSQRLQNGARRHHV